MWLIFVDTMTVACSAALAFASVLTFAVSFALCADVISEHSTENEVLLGSQLMQRTGDDEPDGLQTLASSEIDVHVLSSSRLKDVWDALAL